MVKIKEIKILDPVIKEVKKEKVAEIEEEIDDGLEDILINRRRVRNLSSGKKSTAKLEESGEVQDYPQKKLEEAVEDVQIEKAEAKQDELYKQQSKPKYEGNTQNLTSNRTMSFEPTQNNPAQFGFVPQQNIENLRRPEIQNISLDQQTFVGNRAYDANPEEKASDGRTLLSEDKIKKYK